MPVPKPLISVVMPTYNYARYLPEAIESVLMQEQADFELILLDDCSTDHTVEVGRHYAAKDKRVQFTVNPKNLGMVPNWNHSMELARGDYIKFLFGDDVLSHPRCLQQMADALTANPKVSLVASARHIIDERSDVVDVWDHLGAMGVQNGHDVIMHCLSLTRNLIGEPSVVMFRKRDAQRGYNARYRQIVDLEFWFHLLEKGDLFYFNEPLCAFRVHSLQQSEVNKTQQVGEKEHYFLLGDYHNRPGVKERFGRQALFQNLYALKRAKLEDKPAVAAELEQQLMASLGPSWYALYWAHYKLKRPVDNLKRSVAKRWRKLKRKTPGKT